MLTRVAIHTSVCVVFYSPDPAFTDSGVTSCRLCLSPDQRRALVANTTGGLIVYDLSSAEVITCVRDIRGLDQASPVTFAHGGHAMLVGCGGGQVKLFDTGSAHPLQTLNHEGQCTVCLMIHS